MLGCGVVLAIYRASTASVNLAVAQRLQQLGFGLAYGTGISGVALFIWRWCTGSGPGPREPGHWLLLFCGIGFLIDAFVTAAFSALNWMAWRPSGNAGGYLHQAIAWSIAGLIAFLVLLRLQAASRRWFVAAGLIALAIWLNSAASVVAWVATARGARGSWPWYVCGYAHLAGCAGAVIGIWAAAAGDAMQRMHRDWLHWGGIAAASLLATVEFGILLFWMTR
jgi:hypothetical protein